MSTTKLIPSRPLLRYLNEQIFNASARPFCHQVTQQPSTSSLRRSIQLRPPQQCRHIVITRIAERTMLDTMQADNHKLLGYQKVSMWDEVEFASQKIILWREAEKRPGSKPHVFIGVMTIEVAMKSFLGDPRKAVLDPGSDTSWMLVPRTGFTNDKRGNCDQLGKISKHITEIGATNLDEYLLVKRKSWMVPKTKPEEEMFAKGGRGRAKLIHIDRSILGSNLSVLLAKVHYFLEVCRWNAEFHIHFSNEHYKYSEEEIWKKLITMPGGLALHPRVIQQQLPWDSDIFIEPMSNGKELVWAVAKGYRINGDELIELAKLKLSELEETGELLRKVGRESLKERAGRLKQDEKEIASLKREGKSFDHVLERQWEIGVREENLRVMFKDENSTRRKLKLDTEFRRRERRIHGRKTLYLRLRLHGRLHEDLTERIRHPRKGERSAARSHAIRLLYMERRRISKLRNAGYYSFSARMRARRARRREGFVPGRSDRKVRRSLFFMKASRDRANKGFLLRSPRRVVRTASQIERRNSARKKWLVNLRRR
ncbi:hypothetical protein NHQ30_006315 [Ciborinia camelliae]|nr:hypothetical protein NHQ30_006315 [Ciborinia camelliae]